MDSDPGVTADLDRDAARAHIRAQLFGSDGTEPTIDRFVVRRVLGSGAVGTVYAVHDPRLDREIALKVLRHDAFAAPEVRAARRARLVREARAMARLSHPNVGVVHEVGVVERAGAEPQVWVAMERVLGDSLEAWRARAQPSVPEIIDAYAQFGRGLAAAHAEGIVHRDVKPDNAMRDAAGRVRVFDFGLARAFEGEASLPSDSGERLDVHAVTRTGALIGTPAYMAPEQFDGQPADARADQYAFCVSLYEALWGRPPHAGRTAVELAEARRNGELRVPSRGAVPRRVRSAVLRGLAVSPGDRWPSMEALVGQLEHTSASSWLPTAVGATAAVALVAWRPWATDAEPCPDPTPRLAGAWDDARATAVRAALAATGSPLADEVAARVDERLDAYAQRWTEAVSDSCRATAVEHVQSQAQLERRMSCLDRRRDRLRAVVTALLEVDRTRIHQAVQMVDRLGEIDACLDDARADDPPLPSDPAARRRIEAIDERLGALATTWRDTPATTRLQQTEALLDEARAQQHPALELRVLDELAQAAIEADQDVRAAEALQQRAEIAGSLRDDAAEAASWIGLLNLHTNGHHDAEAGALAAVAAVAVARAGSPRWLRSRLALAGAMLHLHRDEPDAAVEGLAEAVALATTPSARATAEQHLAQALALRDGPLAAVDAGRKALATTEAVYGPGHPRAGDALHLLARFVAGPISPGAATAEQRERLEQALALERRALAIYEATLPPGHRDTAASHHQLGDMLLRLGDRASARVAYERAVTEFERGNSVEDAAVTHAMLAGLIADDDGIDAARPRYEQALAGLARSFGEQHTRYAHMESNFAARLVEAGRCDEATPHLQHVLEVLVERAPSDAAWVMLDAARCDAAGGDAAAGIARLEQARTMCTAHACTFAADIALALGQALVDARREPARALALIDEAEQLATAQGAHDLLQEITDWRARRQPR
ncbi:MAG: serine/threonine-protein kinase [Nannocystaceae bacterium]|nr:serine/threonine-protein kinase [Nannocystaceae bacterium]